MMPPLTHICCVAVVLAVAGCEGMFVQPAALPPITQAPLSPEAEAVIKRARAIQTVSYGLNTSGCTMAPTDPPVCQRNAAPRTLASRATGQLLLGPPPDVEGRVKMAEETLQKAEQALLVAMKATNKPLSGADCNGQTGADRALAFQDSCRALERVRAVIQATNEVVQLAGTPDAAKVRQQAVACPRERQACLAAAKLLEAQSRTGALAGEAAILVRETATQMSGWSYGVSVYNALVLPTATDLTLAEDLVKQAKDEAQRTVDAGAAALAAEQAKMQAEVAATTAVTSACASNWAACKGKCDRGDVASCEVFGMHEWNARPSNVTAARAALAKACDSSSMPTACLNVRKIDADAYAKAGQLEVLWSAVVSVGDDLVQKTYATETLIKFGRNTRALPRIRAVTQAIVAEQYCPAKKAFVTAAGTGEFQRMASTHCKEQAPTSGSPTGDEVILTRQCQQVFATGCP